MKIIGLWIKQEDKFIWGMHAHVTKLNVGISYLHVCCKKKGDKLIRIICRECRELLDPAP